MLGFIQVKPNIRCTNQANEGNVVNKQFNPIAILGAGSWGTALALSLARRDQSVRIWSIDKTEIDAMLRDKANERYLPGLSFPDTIHPTADITEAVRDVEDILVVVPSVGFRQTLSLLKAHIGKTARIICATKGIDTETGELLSEIANDILGSAHPFAVLSGPSFAREVGAGLPAAVMLASTSSSFLQDLMKRFNSPLFRTYPTNDVIGVEVGGIVKNVIAIATGICDGLALGANARSAIITFGLAEMTTLGLALGAQADTFTGLAGLGDLILTCSDNQSRNRRLGLGIGKGQTPADAEKDIGQVVEGKRNAELVVALAKRKGVTMPICETVWGILQNKIDPKEALSKLF